MFRVVLATTQDEVEQMADRSVELDNVIYNAASQAFEALVTVTSPTGTRSYACAIDAPITMSFADAASGLATQALRRDHAGRGLRARRISADRKRPAFDPFAMLRRLAA